MAPYYQDGGAVAWSSRGPLLARHPPGLLGSSEILLAGVSRVPVSLQRRDPSASLPAFPVGSAFIRDYMLFYLLTSIMELLAVEIRGALPGLPLSSLVPKLPLLLQSY